MNNISTILIQTQPNRKNIIDISTLCENQICTNRSLKINQYCLNRQKRICKRCYNFACVDCIAENKEKCVICSDGKIDYCQCCLRVARKFMCYNCGDNIYLDCNCYSKNKFSKLNGFLCKNCE